MPANEAMDAAVEKISGLLGDAATAEARDTIRAAVEEAMVTAIKSNCAENSMVVKTYLDRQAELAQRINEESIRRREALISNLSAMR